MFLLMLAAATAAATAAPAPHDTPSDGVLYDQRQTGDYNVHLDLKNIEIIAILDDGLFGGAGGEYADYDYGDVLTLQPGSPSSSTTTETEEGASPESPTTSSTASTSSSASPSSTTPSLSTLPTTTKAVRRCGAGFYRDSLGRCRRLRRPPLQLSNLLQKASGQLRGE